MARSLKTSSLPVWPYFFLAILTGAFGLVFAVLWWPQTYPDQTDLTKISGEIDRVVIRDDISKTSAGAVLPAVTSVYFTLKGVPGEFRYPSSHPKYPMVRDRTAVAVDIWVRKQETGGQGTRLIWQLQERNPRDKEEELTMVSYGEVTERLTASDRSVANLGLWLLGASLLFLVLGFAVRRWNRRSGQAS